VDLSVLNNRGGEKALQPQEDLHMNRSRADEAALKALYPQPGDRRAELYQNAGQALREKLDRMQSLLEGLHQHYARALYELGRQVKEISDDVERRHGRKYGAGAMDVIQEYFGFDDDGMIYRASRLARTFSEQEIQEATARPKENGEPVSVRDLLVLARVKDPALRQNLLAQAIAQGWSSGELGDAVDELIGEEEPEKADGRGRPLAKPRNFDDVLRQQGRVARDSVTRAERVWTQPGSSVQGMAVDLPTDEVTEERAQRLKAHTELLDRLAQEARARADEARQVYERFVQVLASRPSPSPGDEAREEENLPPPLGPRLPFVRPKGKATRGTRKAKDSETDAKE
jgi:hypothetical protein